LQAGLDYSDEIKHCLTFGFGDAVVLKQNEQISALIVAHTETYSHEEQRQFLKVNILQIKSGLPIQLIDICISTLKTWALESELKALYIRVPVRYSHVYRLLLNQSFKIVQNDFRLILKGYDLPDKPETINLSKWE
jgi:hypothetical protein